MDMVETFHTMSKILQIFPKAALLILLNISLIKYCTQFIQLITNNLKRKINQHKYLSQVQKEIIFQSFLHVHLFTYIGIQLYYIVLLVSAIEQSESAVCIHVSSLFWLSFPFSSPQSAEQSPMCCAVGSHMLSILYTVVYIFPGGGHGNTFQYPCLEHPHGQRSLLGYSPRGHKESDTAE